MLKSPSCDLFNFLMTTLFNTIKMMQMDLKEGDLSHRQEQEKHRIFMTHSLDMQLGELYKNVEVRALVKGID